MSPRAFQTILVASMGSKDRLELESKVLAAALKQSHARGDTSGVSLAHKQIFLLLRQQQAQEKNESVVEPAVVEAVSADSSAVPDWQEKKTEPVEAAPSSSETKAKKKKRVMPDIVWTSNDEGDGAQDESKESQTETLSQAQSDMDESQPDSSEAFAVEPQAESPLSQAAPEGEFDGEKPTFDAYGILAVEQIASFEEIHKHFLFHVRRVLMGLKKAKRKQRKPLLDELQNLWIAHDILSDPVTRTDFDFRILGLRGAPDVIIHSAPEDKQDSISSRTPLRIGELMQCAGLLEPTELEIAADMHKAMPEMLFGAFLVKQGFISEEDLGQVLMGQRLLKNGNMTVGHYQMCMKRWRENQTPIESTAVAEGLVTQQEMERIVASGLRDTAGVPAYQGGAQSQRASAPVINAEEAAKRNLSVGHAVPQWKDQLDWSEPEAIEEYVAEDRDSELRRPIENNLDIEGVTDGVSKDSGKKSLRRLMEGIHSPDSASIGDGADAGKASLKSILSSDPQARDQVKADRLAAPAFETPAEQPPAEKSKKSASLIIDFDKPDDEEIPAAEEPLSESEDPKDLTQEWASAQSVTLDKIQQVSPSQRLEAETETGSDKRNSPTIEISFQGSVKLDSGSAPAAVLDQSTMEQLAIEPETVVNSVEASRPTQEVPIARVVIEERNTKRVTLADDDVFGEVNYDDEDDIEVGFDVESIATPDELSELAPPAVSSSDEKSGEPDDLLDFSTPPQQAEQGKSDIRKVLDEAFHGVRVPELPPHAPPPADLKTADFSEDVVSFEAIADDEHQMQSGVYSIYPGEPKLRENETNETKDDGSRKHAKEFSLSSSILASVDPKLADESSVEIEVALSALKMNEEVSSDAPESSQSAESVGVDAAKTQTPHSDRGTVSMDLPPVSQEPVAATETSKPEHERVEEITDEIEAVKPSGSVTLTDVSMPASARTKPQVPETKADAQKPPPPQQDSSTSAPLTSDEKEDAPGHLKSGEWQIVYKLEGSLADVFLSDEGEQEMPKLRPRLTEIDSIIPSSIAKIGKNDPDKPEGETADSDTKSGDSSSSADKPVIKPVSNNYYRDKGGKNDKSKDSDKQND